jgi:N-acetylmuramoyl-L-alanine amidase
VLATRNSDRFLPLEERTARANAFEADLFVSVHCNGAEVDTKQGIETFVLDTSSDIVASRVAVRENAVSVGATAEVGALLASMRLKDQSTRSTRFASLLQRAAVASTRLADAHVVDGGVHRAGFFVLVGARMPSVLFEVGYLSHADEEARLRDPKYRRRIADGIVNAVLAYREGR